MRWKIYVLEDPRTGAVRYVGKTTNIALRLRQHINGDATRRTKCSAWVSQLLEEFLIPRVRILQYGSGAGFQKAERKWIAHHRAIGSDLTNIAPGGIGGSGPCSSETREKLRLANLGQKRSAETRARISKSKMGHKQSLDTIRRRALAIMGHEVTPETRAKIAASKIGKPRDESTKRKISNALKGMTPSMETREKLKMSQKLRREREARERAQAQS